jgi:hypothetical protein
MTYFSKVIKAGQTGINTDISFRICSGAYDNNHDVVLIEEDGELKWLISFRLLWL